MSSSLAGRATPLRCRFPLGLVVALLLAACGQIVDPSARVEVVLLARNEGPVEAWFEIRPEPQGTSDMGFGQGIGGGCLSGPAGSELVWLTGPSGQVQRTVARLGRMRAVIWVDLAADGSLTAGQGVPAWWAGSETPC